MPQTSAGMLAHGVARDAAYNNGPGGYDPEEIGTAHYPIVSAGGDAAKIESALAKLPDDKLVTIYGAGIQFAATSDSVKQYLSALPDGSPRGWSSSSAWDKVPGFFDPASKMVVIATSGRFAHGSVDLALHETGHGYDFAAGGLSDSAEFVQAYDEAKDGLSSYFLQPGSAGRQETFAESFAAFYSGNQQYAADHPSLKRYWDQHG